MRGLLCLVACIAIPTHGQFVRNSGQYEQLLEEEQAALENELKSHPDLEDRFFPDKYSIPIDFYRMSENEDAYVQNVIFDPCRGFDYNCCEDTFASPEFVELDIDESSDTYGETIVRNDQGVEISSESSRVPDPSLVLDETCLGFLDPHEGCLSERVARETFPQLPRCWNHNESIIADQNCRSPADGSEVELCVELGITQSAYIVECGGTWADSEHCGTFLEIHRPNDLTILSEARLPGQYTSGYRMTVISTAFRGNSSRILCQGEYDLWWVLRTRYDWRVERIMPFKIVSPACDWDEVNAQFEWYATRDTAERLVGLDPYDPTKFLFSRTQTTGSPSQPGKGMGATAHLPTGSEYPENARFIHGDTFTYTFTPERPDLSVRTGELWDTHPDA